MSRLIVLFCLLFSLKGVAQVWTLDSCIRYAYENNLSIQISEQNIALSEINETAAIGGLLPTLNAQGTHGYNWGQRIDQFTNQFASQRIRSNNLGVASSLNLFNGLQQLNTVKQANLNTEASKWNYEKMRNDIALNVASGYLNVLINKEFVDIAQRTFDATSRQVKRMENLVAAGQMSQGNLNDILAQQASDNASYVSANSNYQLAKLSLMQLLRLDSKQLATFDVITPTLDDVENIAMISNPDVVVQAALSNFPEIKSAQTNLASAGIGKKIAKGGYFPSLNASFTYGTGYSGAAKVLTGNPDTMSFPIGTVIGSGEFVMSFPQLSYATTDYSLKPWNEQLRDNVNRSLFFTLNVPLFNGFTTHTSVKRAEVNYLTAELKLEQARQTIEQNVYSAYTSAQGALATYNASKASAEASEKAFSWAEVRYEQGLTNSVEFSDARTRRENALANMTRSKYDYIFKVKVLEFYQGNAITLK